MITQCMLAEARTNAGLGHPPEPFYTNSSECANAIIKRAVNFKPNEISNFCKEMRELVIMRKEDVDSAVCGRGPYKLAKEFEKFSVTQEKWFQKMNAKQRERHLKSFHETGMKASTTPCFSEELEKDCPIPADISIPSLPDATKKGLIEKANRLMLPSENAIVAAPGASEGKNFMVVSKTSKKPHFVCVGVGGKVCCDDQCPSYRSAKVCSHALAVACKVGVLEKFIQWLNSKGPKQMNMTTFVTIDSSSGTGKKGNKPSTARRKGSRSSNAPPPTSITDRLQWFTETAPQSPQQALQHNAPSQPQDVSTQQVPPQMFHHLDPEQPGTWFGAPQQQGIPQQHFPPQFVQYPTIPTYVRVGYPKPRLGQYLIYLLQFCPPQTRSCSGCGKTLRLEGQQTRPPFDMVVVTRQKKEIVTARKEKMLKEGNSYYHTAGYCLAKSHPYFQMNAVQLPAEITPHLTMEHRHYLMCMGVSV